MDESWFEQQWAPAMRARGYVAVFTKKSNPSSREGLGAFIRSAAFELLEAQPLCLSLGVDDAPAALRPLLAAHASTAEAVAQLPSVAQLLLLREAAPASPFSPSPRHLLLANTHLYFSNPGMHVRLMQASAPLKTSQLRPINRHYSPPDDTRPILPPDPAFSHGMVKCTRASRRRPSSSSKRTGRLLNCPPPPRRRSSSPAT